MIILTTYDITFTSLKDKMLNCPKLLYFKQDILHYITDQNMLPY